MPTINLAKANNPKQSSGSNLDFEAQLRTVGGKMGESMDASFRARNAAGFRQDLHPELLGKSIFENF